MNARFAVVSLWAEDVPTTAHFYRDVLQLHLLPHHGGRPHFEVDGVYLTILNGKPRPAQDAEPAHFPLFALAVDDLDAALVPLHAHGIDLPWGIEREGQSRWAKFHDPAGNLIELVEFSA
jgi:catechol 2,3-dioxygenase-like lactoylglutathione lyase family enzyme